MKKAYWVCIFQEINNTEKLKEYAIESPRVVVVEFPDYETAKECYDSKEYQEAHSILEGYVVRHHQIVEGY